MAQSNFPALTVQQVQTAYLAFFNRPADAAGLEYWTSDQHKGGLPGMWSSFGLVDEFTTTYGADPDPAVVVEAFYVNMFNRPSDAPGKAYWLAELSAGRVDIGNLAAAFDAGAAPADKATLSGFVAASTAATQVEIDASFTLTEALAAEELPEAYFLSDATANLGEVTVAAQAAAAANAASIVAGAFNADDLTLAVTYTLADTLANIEAAGDLGGVDYALTNAAGSLGSLTAAQQTLVTSASNGSDYTFGGIFSLSSGTETVTGTDGDDTIIDAVTSSLSSTRTLDVADVVDGGNGTDTINITMNSAFAGFTGSMTNVEVVNLTNTSAISRAFDASGITGVTTYNIDASEAAITLKDLAEAVTVNLSNQESGNFTTAFATGADELTGTSDAMTLGLSNVDVVTVTIADIETLTLNLTGANVVDLAGTDLTDLVITGSGSLEMASVSTSIETVDAAEATGALDLDLTDAAAGSITAVTAGSGDDTITINAEDTRANAALEGGEGTDTLMFETMAAARTVQFAINGFEKLELGATGFVLTFSGTNATGMEEIVVDSTADANASFVNMGSGDYTLTAQGANANTPVITSTHTGSSVINSVASDDALEDGDATEVNNTAFTLTASSSIIINVGAYTTYGGAVNATAAEQLEINVASALDADDDETELTILSSVITAAAAESVEVNALGQVTGADIIVDGATDGVFTFGSSSDSDVDIQAAAMESIVINAGAGLNLSNSDLSAAQVVTLNAGAGHLDLAGESLGAVSQLTITGDDDDAQVSILDLGDDNDYGMTIEATGLASNLVIDNIDVSAGFDIEGTFDDVTGDVTLDDIGSATQGRNVFLSFVGTGGAIDIGTIDATGTITITASGDDTLDIGAIGAAAGSAGVDVDLELDGQTGAITLDAIDGDAITISAANALAGVTYGTITATSSVDLTGSVLNDNTVTVDFDSTDNDVSATLVGGIGDDTFTIEHSIDTNDLTVSVTGGIGDDTIVLSGANGALTIDTLSFSGIETVKVDDTNAVTVNASALSGSDVEVAGTAANDVLILEGTTGADVLDYSDVTGAAQPAELTINLNGGADKVTLTAATETVDIVVFDADSAGVSLTGFETTVDHLDLSNINASFVTANAIIGAGATAAILDGNIVGFTAGAVGTADTGFANTAAELVALINNGTSGAALTAGDEFIAITSDTAAGTKLNIWYVDNAIGGTLSADEVTLIGTLTDITTVAGIVAGDIA